MSFVSHTDDFKQLRKEAFEKIKRMREKIMNKYELVSFTHDNNSESRGSFFRKLNPFSRSLEDSEISNRTNCSHCAEPFGFMGAKYQCQVCEKVICKKCIKKLSLLPPSNEIVNACRRCHAVIKFMKVTKKLGELRNGSNNDALSQFYIDLKNASSQIDTNLPKLQGYIYSLSSIFGDNYDEIISTNIDDMKPFDAPYSAINDLLTAATKITPLLDSNFKKIETLIKRLPELMGIYPSPRYQRVFSMLKIRFNSHIQSSLPSFRISNTRLRDILSHSKIKRIIEESRLERREMDDKERYLSQVKTQNINITESDRLGTPISSSKIQQPIKTQTEHKIEEPSPVVTFQTSRKWGPT